jgi:hypothetical protein
MTVKELIEALSECDPNDHVILSRDSEGNGYLPVWDIEEMMYHDGEVYIRELTEDMIEKGYTEDDLCPYGTKAVVLWP